MKRWKIAGLVIVVLVVVLFALNFAIMRSSPRSRAATIILATIWCACAAAKSAFC